MPCSLNCGKQLLDVFSCTLPAGADHELGEVNLAGRVQRPVVDHLRVVLGVHEKLPVNVQSNLTKNRNASVCKKLSDFSFVSNLVAQARTKFDTAKV